MSHYKEFIDAKARRDIHFRYIDMPESPLKRFSARLVPYDIYLRWQRAAFELVAAEGHKYDIAHHVTWGSLHLGSLIWQLQTPLVYGPIGGGQTAPTNYWRYFGRDWPFELLRSASTGSLLRLNNRSRDTIRNSVVSLVTNSATATACRRLGAVNVRYMLAEGLPPEWIADCRHQPTGTPLVLWVGRMLPRKAPSLAVQAFAKLREVMPARMIMAGNGPLIDQVRAAVEQAGWSGDVEVPGHVPWDELKDLYDSASVFLFNSLRDSSGAQFLEAMGRGLPAVALNHHGIGDLDVGCAAVKVDLPRKPEDLPGRLAGAMQTILRDGEWDARSAAATKWAAGHTWPAKAAAATEIYEESLRIRG